MRILMNIDEISEWYEAGIEGKLIQNLQKI
jgi:hypothetical protein